MSEQPYASVEDAVLTQPAAQFSGLSEKIWHDLREQIPLEQIYYLVGEAAAQFEDATVTTFIPLLIQRQVREWLNAEYGTASMFAAQSAPGMDAQVAA